MRVALCLTGFTGNRNIWKAARRPKIASRRLAVSTPLGRLIKFQYRMSLWQRFFRQAPL